MMTFGRDQKDLIGLTLEEAQKVYSYIRPMRIDGENCVGIANFVPTRCNVEISQGKIVRIISWG